MGPKHIAKKNLTYWIPVRKNKIHVASKPKSARSMATFQESLKATLFMGQMFSLMPVVGILNKNTANLRFVKVHWKIVYTCLSFVGQLFMTIMCTMKVFNDTSLKSTTPVIFYGTTLITMGMFLQVAINWPCLVQHISKTEELDPNFDSKLLYRCNITCAIVLTMALFEHILSLLSAFAGAMVCFPDAHLYEGFVRHFYPWVFNFLPYTPVLGLLTQFLHFQSTFIWNFSDLFVICMSYYLTSRLEQVNKKLTAAQGKYLPEVFWKTSREDYCRVTQLVRRVDDVISGVIFISFANNLFFICLQLFNTLENGVKDTLDCTVRPKGNLNKSHILGGYEAAAYFIFSLVFLISRSVAVSLIASQVNSASNVPAPVLYDVPSPVYCVEVQRFLDQVNGDVVALSGLQFFIVTRGLLLSVAGTIVTYELVMVQFNSPSPSAVPANVSTVLPLLLSTTPTA
ncbi:gustatory receptor for sugar taste 64f-like [Pectinophora gossypiella]|uniref:gustatory receptor for sugar taste 64f-like n=1 Tax=Pectinophora gossypiella TaxID=13191 RepID=UPI00214E7BFD|nr:gustatory receptor for sugar taste 64f-like [Pectinophora gossypiella]